MATVRMKLTKDYKPPKASVYLARLASHAPVAFDEECPPTPESQLSKFRPVRNKINPEIIIPHKSFDRS